jgi:hypothetical protein
MVVITNEVQIRNAPTKVLLQTAEDIVEGMTTQSKVFNKVKFRSCPRFRMVNFIRGVSLAEVAFVRLKSLLP